MTRGRADVIIPAYSHAAMTRACVESVLRHSGPALDRIILVHDSGPDPELRPALRALRDAHPCIRLLENEANLGFVSSANRGLSLRRGDAVVLNNDTAVTAGWLDELLEVLAADPRIAAVSPLSNNATLCTVPTEAWDPAAVQQLPRATEMPTLVGFCMLMRGAVLDQAGAFDPAFGRGYHEENDWCQRVQRLGFTVARANRAFVHHLGSVSFAEGRPDLDVHNARRLIARYPTYLEQNRSFDHGPARRLAAAAVRTSGNPLRVSVVGEAPAVLAALAGLGGLELGSVEAADVVHLLAPAETLAGLERALGGGARLVISAPELSTLISPAARPSWSEVLNLRASAWALAQAADAVVASGEEEGAELARRLAFPPSRVRVVAAGPDQPEAVARGWRDVYRSVVRSPDPSALIAREHLATLLRPG